MARTRKPRAIVGRKLSVTPITGEETFRDLMGTMTAYVGREARDGYEIIRRMVAEDHTVVLAVSGAMASAGYTRSVVVPLIRAGVVDVLVTTHANVYHELQRLATDAFREVRPNADDRALRRAGHTRVYDHVFPEASLHDADQLVQRLLVRPEFQRPMTTPELHEVLARALRKEYPQRALSGTLRGTLLEEAERARVPIFCGAPADASIFLNVAYLAVRARVRKEEFRFAIDAAADIIEFGAYHYEAKTLRKPKRLSIIILGGGVPKNYALQPEPFLAQICGMDVGGYDCDVQVCDAHVQNGGLSSCTANEAHTWGKTSAACIASGSQYVFADASLVAPLYTAALLQEIDTGMLPRKTPQRFLADRQYILTRFEKNFARAEARRSLPPLPRLRRAGPERT